MSAQWGDIATWAGSVGTVGALSAALWQIQHERKARRADERAALAREQRAQAERVSAWYSGPGAPSTEEDEPPTVLSLLNRSDEPVYEAVVTMVFIQGAAPQTGEEWAQHDPAHRYRKVLAVLPPGQWRVTVAGGWGVMQGRVNAEIGFTDRGGAHWIRRSNGALEQLTTNAVDHYAIGRPLDYQTPEPG